MSEHTFRRLARGDERQLSHLAAAVLKEDYPEGYWTWKYLDNPWGEDYSYVAESEGVIFGFVGGMAWQLTVNGTPYPGAQVTDLMMDPVWRRKGVFFPLNKRSQEDIFARASWHYGVTNPTSFRIFQSRYGYQGFRPHKMQKVLNPWPFLLEAIKTRKTFKIPPLRRLIPKLLGRAKGGRLRSDLTVTEAHGFDERFDRLWEKLHRLFPMATTRDSRHLNWRYARHPRFRYTVLAAEKGGGDLCGFAVLRYAREDGIRRCFMVDFLADPAQAGVAETLAAETIAHARRQGAAVLNTWMFEHSPYHAALSLAGFVPKVADTVVILTNSLTDAFSKEFMSNPRNWHFSMGDCEVF